MTSVPAKAIDIDNRVGYVRPGYDADIVVWNSHPLSVGAAPRQVYIDGVATLDPATVEKSFAHVITKQGDAALKGAGVPAARAVLPAKEREEFCSTSRQPKRVFWFTGFSKAFLDSTPVLQPLLKGKQFTEHDELQLVIADGQVVCLGAGHACDGAPWTHTGATVRVNLTDGYVTRGLTAVTVMLGISEVGTEPETGDGEAQVVDLKGAKSADNIDYAKYAVTLGGGQVVAKAFSRARLGGVTRAVQAPVVEGGLIAGVSTGMRTGVNSTLLNGGLFQDDVALHVQLGDHAKVNEGTVSMALERLRALLRGGAKKSKQPEEVDVESPWVLVANGSLPLVITAMGNVSCSALNAAGTITR